MEVVNLPEMDYEGLTAAEALLEFYTDLGWDAKKQNLDPKKVKLSELDHLAFSGILMQLAPESKEIGFLIVNYGPSCGYEKVKCGTVRLYDGWKT